MMKTVFAALFRYRNFARSEAWDFGKSFPRASLTCFHPSRNFSSVSSDEGQVVGSRGQSISIEKAEEIVKEKLKDLVENENNLYLGIGQYCRDPERERVVILCGKFASGWQRKLDEQHTLLDCSLGSECVDKLLERLEKLAKTVEYGEINSVENGKWNYRFTVRPDFNIFTDQSWVCSLGKENLRLLSKGIIEEIDLANIQSVNVHLSEEPWNEQGIDIQLKNDSFTNLVHFEVDNNQRDLATLMIDTEWTVKAAALLCLNMKKLGHKVGLKLPKFLTVQGNPWVENRHHTWTKLMLSTNA